SLGYRGPAGSSLEAEANRRRSLAAPVALIAAQSRSAVSRSSRADAEPAEEGQAGSVQNAVPGAAQEVVTSPAALTADRPGNGRRAVVVAMKPQIAGRIRRNIITLLDLGFEVTVVNSTPRADFFQGLEHPRLSADFVDVRSLAVQYQARMTRKKNERQVKWEDRKSTRLNSRHVSISYAVFCLKKKK